MKKLNNYTITKTTIPTKPGCWDVLKIEVLKDDQRVGEYGRNYRSFYNTFYPFEWRGKEYALYSHNYTTVSLMSLPDCKLIAEHDSGFCPVDFTIPRDIDSPDSGDSYWDEGEIEDKSSLIANMAIVAGCHWGDDSGGWKLKAVDMRKISEGKLEVIPLFGYFESKYEGKLDDAVNWSSNEPARIILPLSVDFQFGKSDEENGFLPYAFVDVKPYRGKSWDNYEMKKTFDADEYHKNKKK